MPPATAGDSLGMVPIGRIRRPSGLKGELSVTAYGDDLARFRPGMNLEVAGSIYTVATARQGPRGAVLLGFEEISDVDSASQMRGAEILAHTADLPKQPDGVYYHYQLVGLAAQTIDGHKMGTVTGIMETGGNDVYVVKAADGREILVPALKDTVVGIDLAAGTMTIDPPPGLIR